VFIHRSFNSNRVHGINHTLQLSIAQVDEYMRLGWLTRRVSRASLASVGIQPVVRQRRYLFKRIRPLYGK